MAAPLVVIYRPKRTFPTKDCTIIYVNRKDKPTLDEIVRFAENGLDPDILRHLLECRPCRKHVQRRDHGIQSEEEMDARLYAAIEHIVQKIQHREVVTRARIERKLIRARQRK
ncbi:MAG TPA: hypothetical protein VMA75_02655 [Candidatus Paceibacterota bacterium]|nr:hypothetical protein [Candidatus Paceibacterota bacterium]